MFLTKDQEYILTIIKATRVLRRIHAFSLLSKLDSEIPDWYCDKCLRQLQHISRIAWSTKAEDVFTLPEMYDRPIDTDLLAAIDIMLDLTDKRIQAISAPGPPFKLRFLTERKSKLKGYAIAAVPPGNEAPMAALINESAPAAGSAAIILLSDMSQMETLRIRIPHYFVIRGANGYRYFEGGD